MNGGSKVVGLRPDEETAASHDEALADGVEQSVEAFDDEDFEIDAIDGYPQRTWLWPALAIVAIAAWLGGMLYLALPTLPQSMAPVALVEFIAALCVPPALIGIFWLLVMRTSRAEAYRFGATARAMRAEAEHLEHRVSALSRKIEANRADLAEQTTLLMSLGDDAAERLRAISNGMSEQVGKVQASANLLTTSSEQAEKVIDVVVMALPSAQASVTDMAAKLETVGMSATEHAAGLDAQLAALADRGREADRVTGSAAQKLAAHIARMEATSETASARLEKVSGEMSHAVDEALARAAQAVDEARKGITAQGEAMVAMLSSNQGAMERAGEEGVAALAQRIEAVDAAIADIAAKLGEQHDRSAALFDTLHQGTSDIDARFDRFHADGMKRSQDLAASISALTESANAMREAMLSGDETAHRVIATGETLLTALDAAAREMDETLPAALERLDTRINASREVVAASKPELLALVTAAESTHDAIEAIAVVVANQRDTLATITESLLENLDIGRGRIDDVQKIVDATVDSTQRFADEAAPQLVASLARIRETASSASDQARSTLASVIPAAARKLEQEGADALGRAVETSVSRQIAELHRTSEEAVAAAAQASHRLAEQMRTISESSAAIEARIADARAEREESDRDTFARRVSLLIEALNSASIDITKTFNHEVSDSAWAAYLKGDRGVFTRRAVRLLEPTEAREIGRMYDDDSAFREQVNRYIHDFEAMLRHILSLRDGSPLGVTLLSSDMGKLYVALAQAIERLRT